MDFDQPPVVRVDLSPDAALDPRQWPLTIPAVAQVAREGMDLAKGVTFLVGENGSGKSTIVEAVAMAFGLSPEGGSTHSMHATRRRSRRSGRRSGCIAGWRRPSGASSSGPRPCTAGTPTSSSTPAPDNPDPRFHELSHGESFLALLETRFEGGGLYCLDEPEAALSFSSTLALIAVLQRVVAAKGQVLCATHSPVLASLPGARILEVGDWGLRETTWDDLELVAHWKRFLGAPQAYLRHLSDD